MSPCAINRYLIPAAMGGFVVALATGNGWLGWLGGALVAGVLWMRRGTAPDTACAWSPPPVDHGNDADLEVDIDLSSDEQVEAPLTSTRRSPER